MPGATAVFQLGREEDRARGQIQRPWVHHWVIQISLQLVIGILNNSNLHLVLKKEKSKCIYLLVLLELGFSVVAIQSFMTDKFEEFIFYLAFNIIFEKTLLYLLFTWKVVLWVCQLTQRWAVFKGLLIFNNACKSCNRVSMNFTAFYGGSVGRLLGIGHVAVWITEHIRPW